VQQDSITPVMRGRTDRKKRIRHGKEAYSGPLRRIEEANARGHFRPGWRLEPAIL